MDVCWRAASQPIHPSMSFHMDHLMARKNKADAQITRDHLLDAAEYLFQKQGVSRTSLQQIAEQAGMTRGAIYWHFKDKAELFHAMLERVHLPFEEIIEHLQQDRSHSPLSRLLQIMTQGLTRIQTDDRTRRVFEIVCLKVESTEEMHAVITRREESRRNFISMIETEITTAIASEQVRTDLNPHLTALAFHSMLDGLIYNWLLMPTDFDLMAAGQLAYDIFAIGLQTAHQPAPALT
jgi:TetR/AcrR family acrAB operon transcriptional repressor